ncbi:similar to Torulaspora delbrueckii TDEL_0B04870 hypothetical protein [Maudiozyma saulgeensis]|uniref:Uncharacterized protein n=1 Tax=Maudiozyma saulgeensis TaxID=1789683 RepID=A0A1X7QYW2_9SACH|nr:similar to Torulaspora delbrueckii TDEL_0B04870 hypothetical protein [Kazachstania saulgeensis]
MKNDIVILNINNFDKRFTPRDGYYYIIGIGKNYQRFDSTVNQVLLELKFKPFTDMKNTSIDLYMFKRNPRSISNTKKEIYQCRTRSYIDYYSLKLREIKCSTLRETYADWDNINITYPRSKSFLQISIEYYPSTPIIPTIRKVPINSQFDKKINTMKEDKDIVIGPLIMQKYHGKRKDYNVEYSHTKNIKQVGKLLKNIFKDHSFNNNGIPDYEEDIFLDIDNPATSIESQSIYSNSMDQDTLGHSLDTENELTLNIAKNNTYQHNTIIHSFTFESKDGDKPVSDILPLEVSVPIFLNNFSNRLQYNECIDWTNIFEPMNVRVTGYLGNGKWENKELAGSLLTWYLQPHVQSLVPPKLPPKLCPKNILWEEYYLIDKQELITQYSNL